MTLTCEQPHIFDIHTDVWNALGAEEIEATVQAMKEFGIYRLPYDTGEIVIRIHHGKLNGHQIVTEAKGLRENEVFTEEVVFYPGVSKGHLAAYKAHIAANPVSWAYTNKDHSELQEGQPPDVEVVHLGVGLEGKQVVYRVREIRKQDARKFFFDGLVVLLASKGLSKISRKSGLAKLGIGKKTGEYITTLRLEQNLSSHETVRPGHPIRPHLRRGHIRMQPHGPGNSLRKAMWIEPCFVNADADFVSERKAYRVLH